MRYTPDTLVSGTMTRLLLVVVFSSLLFQGCEIQPENPNVIFILIDDQGWADIGYNNPKVYTPNLDKLAAGGAQFTQHYVMPQCTPTRVALLTGRYPGRFGPQALSASNEPAFPAGTVTMASVFKASGYSTYLVGKWHLGSTRESGPNNFGFDESYGSLTGAVGMYDHRYREGEFENTWHRNLEIIEDSDNGAHTTDLLAQEAISIIERDRNQPFFLYLAFNAVHTPLDERGRFVDEPTALHPEDSTRWNHEDEIPWFNDPDGKIQSEPDPEKRLFLAATYHLDDAIGQIVAAVDERGLRENTLIVYSSDNGPQVTWPGSAYPDDLWLTDFNQPLPVRGKKTDVWEGGIHVPAFANWPGHIEQKTIPDQVHIIDWLPTLSILIAGKDPAELDGIDISSALFEDVPLPERDLYWIWHWNTNRWALRFGDWKIVKYGRDEPRTEDAWALFNLADDPQEQENVASQHPDIVELLHAKFLVQRAKDER